MATSKLKHTEKWYGDHKGIRFQIKQHESPAIPSMGDRAYPVWCYYLLLSEHQVPKAKQPRFFLDLVIKPLTLGGRDYLTYDYYSDESAFGSLSSWHGGITYYDYVVSTPGHRVVKAGCDWNHAWDNAEDDPFSLECIESEARATVDELWELHPDLLVRCDYTGDFHPLSDLEPWGDGYISELGRTKREENSQRTAK